MRVRAGSVFLLHKPTATETTKQRNVQKNFRISRLFSFSLSMFLNVWVYVCVCGDSGVALWYNSLKCHNNLQRNDICKVTRQNSLKMMHKHVFSLSLFHFQNKRAFNMRIDECAVSTENKKNGISSLFSCQFPI